MHILCLSFPSYLKERFAFRLGGGVPRDVVPASSQAGVSELLGPTCNPPPRGPDYCSSGERRGKRVQHPSLGLNSRAPLANTFSNLTSHLTPHQNAPSPVSFSEAKNTATNFPAAHFAGEPEVRNPPISLPKAQSKSRWGKTRGET